MSPRVPLQPGSAGLTTVRETNGQLATRGTWQADVRYRSLSGEVVQLRRFAMTRAAAQAAIQAAIEERRTTAKSAGGGRLNAAMTVNKLLDWYLETIAVQRDYRPQTIRSYTSILDTHIRPRLGNLRLSEVTRSMAQDLIQGLANAGLKRQPALARQLMTSVFAEAVNREAIPASPWSDTKLPRQPRKSRFEIKVFTQEQVDALRAHIEAYYDGHRPGPRANGQMVLLVFDLILYSAARPGEVLALRRRDVTFDERGFPLLHIEGTIVGKEGARGGNVRQPHPKTRGSVGVVPVPRHLEPRLREWLNAHPGGTDGLIFQTRNGYPVSGSTLRAWIRRASVGSIWERAFHPYILRRSMATWIAAERGDEAAMGLLRHASVAITRASYINPGRSTVSTEIAEWVEGAVVIGAQARAWNDAFDPFEGTIFDAAGDN
jgi:integrase